MSRWIARRSCWCTMETGSREPNISVWTWPRMWLRTRHSRKRILGYSRPTPIRSDPSKMSDALNAISDYAEPAQLQAALETLSDEIAGKLQLPATAIGDVLSGQYERAMKGIRTVQGKILKQLGTHSVEIDNLLDPSATPILQSLNTATAEIEWLLQSAAVKGGMLGVGDRLTPEAIAQM